MSILRASTAEAVLEEHSLAFNVCAATGEKIPQLGGQILAGRQRIQRQVNFAARCESRLQIAKQEIPFTRSPTGIGGAIAIKADRKCSNPIELLLKIRQRLKRFDPENRPWHSEDFEQFPEKRRFVDVQAENGMIEVLQYEQEKSATTTEIEHALRRSAMK